MLRKPDIRFDALVFDFDGVIVESTDIKTDAFRTLFADYPEHLYEIEALHLRHGGVDRLTKFEMVYRDILHLPLDRVTTDVLARRFEALVEERVIACPMVAGAAELLPRIAGRIPLAIVSGTPKAELDRIVARRGLRRYFTALCGSPGTKSDALCALIAAREWRAARVLMVGDAMTDYEASAMTGTKFLGRVRQGAKSPFPAGTPIVADLVEFEHALATYPLSPAQPEAAAS